MRMIILEDRQKGGTLHQKIYVGGGEIIEESFDIAAHSNFEGDKYPAERHVT